MTIGKYGQNLIFILSQPRSGSTLLQRVLAAHPRIVTTAEPWLMLHPIYAFRSDGIRTEYDHSLATSALKSYLDNVPNGYEKYQDAIRHFAVSLYNSSLARSEANRFVDKTPRYYYITDELIHLFPNAKFILLFRNPVAVLSSILSTHVQGHWPLLTRYKDDLILAPERLTRLKEQTDENVHTLRYEQFVMQPEKTTASICDFLEISFKRSMIDYGDIQGPPGSLGDKYEVNRAKRPHTDRVDVWKELARDEQTRDLALAYLRELGKKTVALMGYDSQIIEHELNSERHSTNVQITTWNELMHPTAEQLTRQKYTELAILEHRRIVFRIKRFMRHFYNS